MSGVEKLARRAKLAWWLGPWSSSARPSHVRRRTVTVGSGGPSYVYEPTDRAARRAWLISPGLHHEGPDDPRMERLAAVLASSGSVVMSPRSAELCELRIGRGAITALEQAHVALAADAAARGLPLHVMSVSVGALAAMRLAAHPRYGGEIERVVVVGGYADPAALVASLCGADAAPRDPLNQPAAFLTFLERLPGPIADRRRLAEAWRWFVRTAWARPAWKQPGSTAHRRAARELLGEVDARDRELFLIGCGAAPGGHELVRAAQESGGFGYLDWRPHAASVRAEVVAIHGVKDHVIPIEQLEAITVAVPQAKAIRLGGFSHSSAIGGRQLLAQLPRLAEEARAFGQVLRAVA